MTLFLESNSASIFAQKNATISDCLSNINKKKSRIRHEAPLRQHGGVVLHLSDDEGDDGGYDDETQSDQSEEVSTAHSLPHVTHEDEQRQAMVVLVGLSGSGKSSFAQDFIHKMAEQGICYISYLSSNYVLVKLTKKIGNMVWHRINQDQLKTKEKCIEMTKLKLDRRDVRCSVIIDRTNLTIDQAC